MKGECIALVESRIWEGWRIQEQWEYRSRSTSVDESLYRCVVCVCPAPGALRAWRARRNNEHDVEVHAGPSVGVSVSAGNVTGRQRDWSRYSQSYQIGEKPAVVETRTVLRKHHIVPEYLGRVLPDQQRSVSTIFRWFLCIHNLGYDLPGRHSGYLAQQPICLAFSVMSTGRLSNGLYLQPPTKFKLSR